MTKRRSLAKAVCWESFSYFLAMIVTYWYLQSFEISLRLTSILFVIKIVFFFAHERLWHKINWGKVSTKE
jgi:adenylylsulfate kinase